MPACHCHASAMVVVDAPSETVIPKGTGLIYHSSRKVTNSTWYWGVGYCSDKPDCVGWRKNVEDFGTLDSENG